MSLRELAEARTTDGSWVSSLLSLLQCSVCGIPCTPRLHQCTNGHLNCHQCLANLDKCPLCREPSIYNRNLAAERILLLFDPPVACTYGPYGCQAQCRVSEMPIHEITCSRRPFPCPEVACSRHDALPDIRAHFLRSHSFRLVRAPAATEALHWPEDTRACLLATPKVFECEGHTFVANTLIRQHRLLILVQVFGDTDVAARFEHEVVAHGPLAPLNFVGPVQSLLTGQRRILAQGPCFSADLDAAPGLNAGRQLWHSILIRLKVEASGSKLA